MGVTHTPSDATLMRYAAGTLSDGAALVVAAHLAFSHESRCRVDQFEVIGGQVLDEMPPADMMESALSRILARIEVPPPAPALASSVASRAAARRRLPVMPEGIVIPEPLAAYGASDWRFLGPGIRYSRVNVPTSAGENVMLLKVAPGRKMPSHSHSGDEFTCVLHGIFRDETGSFGPGDFEEADDDLQHSPHAGPDAPCICLIYTAGKLKINSVLGRLVQPIVGL
jgi:putative transcriptional regulator